MESNKNVRIFIKHLPITYQICEENMTEILSFFLQMLPVIIHPQHVHDYQSELCCQVVELTITREENFLKNSVVQTNTSNIV